MTHGGIWYSLDTAAAANLPVPRLVEFSRYRDELREDGLSWEEAEQILRGFIWNEIEATHPGDDERD
jgi:hypothetical protein